jgi:hypothetical protein
MSANINNLQLRAILAKRLKVAKEHLQTLEGVYKKKKEPSVSYDVRMQMLVIQAIQMQIKEVNEDIEALAVYEIEADWIEV